MIELYYKNKLDQGQIFSSLSVQHSTLLQMRLRKDGFPTQILADEEFTSNFDEILDYYSLRVINLTNQIIKRTHAFGNATLEERLIWNKSTAIGYSKKKKMNITFIDAVQSHRS